MTLVITSLLLQLKAVFLDAGEIIFFCKAVSFLGFVILCHSGSDHERKEASMM